MAERINVRRRGRELEFSELLPAEAALNVIPVSIAGFVLEDLIIPPAELPSYEITTHVAGVFRDAPPCFMHWTESGRARRYRTDPGTLFIRSPQPMPAVRSDGPTCALALSLSVETMEQALPEPFTKRPVMLASLMPGPPDRVLTHLLGAIEAEVKAGCRRDGFCWKTWATPQLSTWRNVTACFLLLRLASTAVLRAIAWLAS